ncbi:MAG: hypothetical protein B7Y11_11485 [Sphingobacteriia bacterium 24-36-13]|jgi:hypothetical protein|uniref:hypothetical protein n=1 Tax=Sediminibacterium sp. TaxID=1917865 RepID=UPI000BD522FA|nr:hypothetical protein [Sediminibacterium sp.]OYY10617.1 MAG: hypothetical protein B7Y66_05355 [Sphingobacteriia bacterium 35-36-14]OYZ52678.1 MAG: hypothetical protein B7Y11_11485 [Sphingobacteriia bacterium 24-36-13]OZA64897.1 MAG: hypothetical protein B7X68_05755 [Sphingobacteriia bacterium 39-36-14]HQS24439.1 hypothetical protein [Sediminibacterium sp.]HQS35995.1 hypothetical protein [Sediminibacterium sp.]
MISETSTNSNTHQKEPLDNNSVAGVQWNFIVTGFAKMVSYLFHPLFIPTYFFLYLMQYYSFEFAGITDWQLKLRLFGVFWMTAFFPAFAVFLLWRLKFSSGIFLRTQKERIVPYIITMFFYWWMHYLSRNFPDQPEVLKFFYTGIFICSVAGLLANNSYKISMHAMGAGGFAAALILTSFHYQNTDGIAISIAVLLAGIICTARLILKEHSLKEVYTGLAAGAICQLLSYYFVM